MRTDLLFYYLQLRAQIEGMEFALDQEEFFESYFDWGVRKFFGIVVDDDCFPLYDEQEPKNHPGLLQAFIKSYLNPS